MWSVSPVDSSSSEEVEWCEAYSEAAFECLSGELADLLMNRTTDKQKRRFAAIVYMEHLGNYTMQFCELKAMRLGKHAESKHIVDYMLDVVLPFNLKMIRSVKQHYHFFGGFQNLNYPGYDE